MIGMPLECAKSKEVIVQVSKHNPRETAFLSLTSLTNALETDPDLGILSSRDLPQLLQDFFGTGCDYISFFSQIGKASFLKYFLQYAPFIIDGANPLTPGSLVNICLANHDWKLGLLSFLRLIGTENTHQLLMCSLQLHISTSFATHLYLLKSSITND